MGKSILIILFLTKIFLVNASNADSLVNIEGYYITRYLKSEITFSYAQKIERIKNEPYSIPIDFTQISFFIPIVINGKKINEKSSIAQTMAHENNLRKDSIYFIPTNKETEEKIYSVFNERYDFSNEIAILSEISYLSPFYKKNNDDCYLYKCMYIEGSFMEKTIPNIEEIRAKLFIDVDRINKQTDFLKLFFLNKICLYTSIIDIDTLVPWFPYVEK